MEICPTISPASIHSLAITAPVLYEIMNSVVGGPRHGLYDYTTQPISSTVWVLRDKAATLGSVFDFAKAESICDSYGLEFDDRIVVQPDGAVCIQGKLKKSVRPAVSYSDLRKKRTGSASARSETKTSSPSSQVEIVDRDIKEIEKNLKTENASLRQLTAKIHGLKQIRPSLSVQEKTILTKNLKVFKSRRAIKQTGITKIKLRLKSLRNQRHSLLKAGLSGLSKASCLLMVYVL